jgi:hypothetical protein
VNEAERIVRAIRGRLLSFLRAPRGAGEDRFPRSGERTIFRPNQAILDGHAGQYVFNIGTGRLADRFDHDVGRQLVGTGLDRLRSPPAALVGFA